MTSLINAALRYCDVDYSSGQYQRLPEMTGVVIASLIGASLRYFDVLRSLS